MDRPTGCGPVVSGFDSHPSPQNLLIDMFVLVYLNILINVYFGFVAYLQNKHMRKAVNTAG